MCKGVVCAPRPKIPPHPIFVIHLAELQGLISVVYRIVGATNGYVENRRWRHSIAMGYWKSFWFHSDCNLL